MSNENNFSLEMDCTPKSKAQFLAYMTFQDWLTDSTFIGDATTNVTITITGIEYRRAYRKQEMEWSFTGKIVYREFRFMGQGNGWSWVTTNVMAFRKSIVKSDVNAFVKKTFA